MIILVQNLNNDFDYQIFLLLSLVFNINIKINLSLFYKKINSYEPELENNTLNEPTIFIKINYSQYSFRNSDRKNGILFFLKILKKYFIIKLNIN